MSGVAQLSDFDEQLYKVRTCVPACGCVRVGGRVCV